MVFVTPAAKALKDRGDWVGLVCKPHGRAIFHNSGLIDRLHIWTAEDEAFVDKADGMEWAEAAWELAKSKYGAGYDEIVILDNVIENKLLHSTRRPEVVARTRDGAYIRWVEDHGPWDRGERPFRYDDYYLAMVQAVGITEKCDLKPVWKPTAGERRWAAKFRRRRKLIGRKLVVFQLAGSGPTKAWPYWPWLADRLLGAYPDMHIVTLGVGGDEVLEWDWAEAHIRVIPLASRQTIRAGGTAPAWNRIRREAALVEQADLLVSPDTSLLHCVGAMATPKIALMTICHQDNMLRHYLNCRAIQSPAPCSPCGKLTVDCRRGGRTGAILCMDLISPGSVAAEAEKILGN